MARVTGAVSRMRRASYLFSGSMLEMSGRLGALRALMQREFAFS
jgi:hypothetical protein